MSCTRRNPPSLDDLSTTNINCDSIPQDSQAAYLAQRQFLNSYKMGAAAKTKKDPNTLRKRRALTQLSQGKQQRRDSEHTQATQRATYPTQTQDTPYSFPDCSHHSVPIMHDRTQRVYDDITSGAIRMKLFSNALETKQDIDRLEREKRFLKGKHRESPMPHRPLIDVYTSPTAKQQAKHFTTQVQTEQEYLLGKGLMRRKMEEKKRKRRERSKEREEGERRENQRMVRRIKAEQNILLIQERKKINEIIRERKHISSNISGCI